MILTYHPCLLTSWARGGNVSIHSYTVLLWAIVILQDSEILLILSQLAFFQWMHKFIGQVMFSVFIWINSHVRMDLTFKNILNSNSCPPFFYLVSYWKFCYLRHSCCPFLFSLSFQRQLVSSLLTEVLQGRALVCYLSAPRSRAKRLQLIFSHLIFEVQLSSWGSNKVWGSSVLQAPVKLHFY